MYKRKRGFLGKLIIILVVTAVLLGSLYYFITTYTIKNISIEGNVHYTNEEIQAMVLDGVFLNNSWYLSKKYANKGISDIPFVDAIDVTILTPDTIRISVYEKALAGFVEYLGRYMYFDKDGTIIESSDVKTIGVPQIIGLDFQSVVLGKPLPVEDNTVFRQILSITQLLNKYAVTMEKIYFDSNYNVTLIIDSVRIRLGEGTGLEEKIMILPELLPSLEGKKGVLKMENYSESSTNISFEPDKDAEEATN